jgi:hypothetical protein
VRKNFLYIKQATLHEEVLEIGDVASRILERGTTWR